ncbi:unnamed protein product [Meganyctiphanes norvegica]|uniref:RING-type domain-containing protein n=1 Tax=Meganyctiphanes norvegica TaxID=48144 RepID=A0AAV2STU3_MEGNR
MDVPECNVCHIPLDEEEHQPRHLGCSHDSCTACIKALIKNGSFECPMCRKVIKANTAEDLPINHGVIQVLRLFKSFKVSEREPNEEGSTAITKELCKIHKCIVDKRCITCKVWICVQCKELHIPGIGCEIQAYNEALKEMRKEHKKQVEPTLSSIRNNLQSISSKLSGIESEKKKLEEEIEKLDGLHKDLQKAAEDGTKVLNEIVAATVKADKAITSKEFDESVQTANEWHQFAQVWCKINTDFLPEKNKFDQEGYATMNINGKSTQCKISLGHGNVYFHCFRINGFNINKSMKIYSHEQIKSLLSAARDLVFLDLAICGQVKGRVTIRLRQDLPTYAKNIPLLFTGEKGHALLGLSCVHCLDHNLGISGSITTNINGFKQDSNAGYTVTQGSILARWSGNNIDTFYIHHEQGIQPYMITYEVFGQIETGLDIVKLCKNHTDQREVTVIDCGLVVK